MTLLTRCFVSKITDHLSTLRGIICMLLPECDVTQNNASQRVSPFRRDDKLRKLTDFGHYSSHGSHCQNVVNT